MREAGGARDGDPLGIAACGGDYEPRACTKDPAPVFSHALIDPATLVLVTEPGGLGGGGQLIVGRSYVYLAPEVLAGGGRAGLFAPTDMELIAYTHYRDPGAPTAAPQWNLRFQVSCEVQLVFGHVNEVPPKIADLEPAGSAPSVMQIEVDPPLRFAAGENIGAKIHLPEYGGDSFDFELKNTAVRNQFVNQARYEAEPVKDIVFLDCPWEYFAEPLRSEYFALLGDIDNRGQLVTLGRTTCRETSQDVIGTLSGTWFLDEEPVFAINPSGDLRTGNYGAYVHFVDQFGLYAWIGNLGPRITSYKIWADDPSYLDPHEVTDRHCYQLEAGYVDAHLTSATSLRLVYATEGTCPAAFDDALAVSYFR